LEDKPEVQGVPIVAMTASAIQGDKEKCQLAGMDDYLAKPVKGKVLERMLVKWAIEGRRKTAKTLLSNNVDDRHRNASTSVSVPITNPSNKDRPQDAGSLGEPETTARALTAKLDRLNFETGAAFARSSESNGERAMRRIHAEERDTMLRDDKLLALTTGPDTFRPNSHQDIPVAEAPMPLTEENIEKLVHGQEGHSKTPRKASLDKDSNVVNRIHSFATTTTNNPEMRPSLLDNRHRDSETTVTKEGLS